MSISIKELSDGVLALPSYSKKIIVMIIDICICALCTWIAYILRFDEIILIKDINIYSSLISLIIAIPIFWLFGLYRTIFRYTGLSIIFNVSNSVFVYGLLYFLVIGVYGLAGTPRSIGIIQPMLLFFGVLASRLFIKFILSRSQGYKKSSIKKNVLIYGAGNAGRQLVFALDNSHEFKVLGFLDDNNELHGRVLHGQYIYSPSMIKNIIKKKNISLIFLALPSISRTKRNQIIKNLNDYHLAVQTLPSISEIVNGKITLSDIKDLNIDDLLSRDEVKPNSDLLKKNIFSKTVLVTGAGGSIGSEICRQTARLKPKKIILLELNEFALYKIQDELKTSNIGLKIISLLVNVQDQKKLETILELFNVDTIYHAAAYKHVNLVEENICEGVKNNVFSTLAIAKASMLKKVSNLVLISSDKAVRPTNIMGASKRLSELCIQGVYNDTENCSTKISIVRFGNVLESSGSVIPKFKKQICDGGPVTLTHDNVERYFMTITEAAQLVIQAGAMGIKSEVFVLDMGKSIKIKDLIYRMISLSGLTIKDDKNPTGDIEIKIIGLRPGEKLYEELLIGDSPQKTNHSKIMKISDPFIPFDQLKKDLDNLEKLLDKNDTLKVINFLKKILSSYNPNSEIIDHIHIEKIANKQ